MAKILIIDDSSFQRRMIKDVLKELGHQVSEADDGVAGLAAVESNNDLDLVLLDLLMPEMDGFELLERLREKGCAVPRVVLTADVQQGSIDRCLELGAVTVLSKPPDPKHLQEVIEVHTGAGSAAE